MSTHIENYHADESKNDAVNVLLLENGAHLRIGFRGIFYELKDAFVYAARVGNIGLIKLCKKLGAIDVDSVDTDAVDYVTIKAIDGSDEMTAQLLHEWNVSNANRAMIAAAAGGT